MTPADQTYFLIITRCFQKEKSIRPYLCVCAYAVSAHPAQVLPFERHRLAARKSNKVCGAAAVFPGLCSHRAVNSSYSCCREARLKSSTLKHDTALVGETSTGGITCSFKTRCSLFKITIKGIKHL